MATAKTLNEKHLKLRGNIFWYVRRVPKKLIPLYGKDKLEKTLNTSDIRLARILRDEINNEMEKFKYDTNAFNRRLFENSLEEMSNYKRPTEGRPNQSYIDFPLSSADLRAMGHEQEANALDVLEGRIERQDMHPLTLKESAELIITRKDKSVTEATKQKYLKSAEKFSAFMRTSPDNLSLKLLDRVSVHKYVQYMEDQVTFPLK
ncbi:hypothetical protein J6I90_12775 [Pseudidiomarina sp. 1APP75-32.1]|uniref:DUF6538 domain-containing protein n=1 Tax=Pseudidiomarina terrestris TaxID=2820060 RepID=A0AAW7R1W5_9GAMM|nr:DUF6538 domain-containing protein [Pseudidiomarina sp. 1APP75-32.1]MDN7125757.1 hypothetical protein [Pseudidiomarina sp. 1APP75-32.1]